MKQVQEKANVFSYTDYKPYLKTQLKERWGSMTKLAQAAGCQRSYLSRVVNSYIHLTPEHAYGLCRFWKFSPDETTYFMTLVEHARSATSEYRRHLESKLKLLRQQHEDLSNRVQRPVVEFGNQQAVYYSAWYWSAVHILSAIPEYQSVDVISRRLQLPATLVESVLQTLREFGFVTHKAGRWSYAPSEIHVPKHSPLVGLHHGNWRQRAVLASQTPGEDGLHYTIVQSMSRDAFEKIKALLLNFIDESSRIGGPSQSEELVSITCDVFKA